MIKLLKKILLLLPIPAVVFTTTWIVDPANIKDAGSYEAGVASILLSGKNVANLVNYNERILQQKFVSGLSKAPDVLVIGSSRSMPINSSFFPDRYLLNSSVSGASIEDYLGVFDLYRKRGLKPKLIIIGPDPWVLNRNNGQDSWKDLNAEYYEMRSILGFSFDSAASDKKDFLNQMIKCKKYKEFLSPSYFNQSFIELVQGRTGKKYWATDKFLAEEPIKIADGSYVYGKMFRDKTVADINSAAKTYAMAKPMYSMNRFNELDQPTIRLLDGFIEHLKNNDIKVLIFLAPFHPIVYRAIRSNTAYAMVAESEKMYRFLANKHKINIVGSYDPKASNLEESDFYDGMHPKNQAVHRIFDNAAQ